MGDGRTESIEGLLAESGWLRALALRLAGDADVAEDAVQETWIAALRRAPEAGESVRPWLATVLRNALRMRARGEGRRAAREKGARELEGEVATPEALVARAEAQRLLADLVLQLEEPYRSTVLLHFFEELSLADIARDAGVAASTARWRLKVALDRLRDRLEAETGGRRRRALAPLLALPKGALVAQQSSKLITAALILLLLIGGGALYLLRRGGGGEEAAGDEGPSHGLILSPAARLAATRSDEPGAALAWLAQPGVQPRRIAGHVTFEGAPVSGAVVELASLATEGGAGETPRRITDASGAFDFGPRPGMPWSVRAAAPGKTGVALIVDLRNPAAKPPSDDIELALGPCDAALFGHVRDASGGPIAGARLAGLPRQRLSEVPGGVGVETDAKGAYELCVPRIWPGAVAFEVSADGYGAILYRGIVVDRVETDFALVPEAVVVGRVVRADDGAPVAGARVVVGRGPGGVESTAWRAGFSGEDGRFRIDGVAPGRHAIYARAEGLSAPARGFEVSAAAGETSEEIELALVPATTLRGVVREGGRPVAGARVWARAADESAGSRSAVSQEDGSFVLTDAPRGAVRFVVRGYEVVSPEIVQVGAGERDDVVLEVESFGSIGGIVTRHGRPVGGALIHLNGPNQFLLEPVHTGDDGRFEARGLRPGRWKLIAESDRLGAFGPAAETVDLERGERAEVAINLAFGATISGTVVDQRGEPVAGADVFFSHTTRDDAGRAVTASDGHFRAAMMYGSGRYATQVHPYPGAAVSLPPAPGHSLPVIDLADGDAEASGVVIAVTLDRLAIAGRVVDEGGAPVADARVVAAMAEGDAQPRFMRWVNNAAAVTDVEGNFAIGELPAGTYALEARAGSGAEATVSGVAAGRDDVVLTLPRPGAVAGTLVGFSKSPRVTARRTDVDGAAVLGPGRVTGSSFEIGGLPAGSYVVTARAGAQAASARVAVAAGATARTRLEARGSGSVVGHVLTFRGGEPVAGMSCVVEPRIGDQGSGAFPGALAHSDAAGRFVIEAAPAGPVAVMCYGSGPLYTDGLRQIKVPVDGRLEIDVPVVAELGVGSGAFADLGAAIDTQGLLPRLIGVRPGGPAARAGLANGDVVVAVDGESVTELSPRGVWRLLTNRAPGSRVEVTVRRGGNPVTATLNPGERPTP